MAKSMADGDIAGTRDATEAKWSHVTEHRASFLFARLVLLFSTVRCWLGFLLGDPRGWIGSVWLSGRFLQRTYASMLIY